MNRTELRDALTGLYNHTDDPRLIEEIRKVVEKVLGPPTRDEAVPTGWKLVPVEPTEAMIEAHFEAHAKAKTVFAEVPDIWRAMLASVPAPASGGVDAVAEREAFEGWVNETPHPRFDLARGDGSDPVFGKGYVDYSTTHAWNAWKARASLSPAATPVSEAGGEHGPFGYLIIVPGLDEEHWFLRDDPEPMSGYVSLPMFTKVDPFSLGDDGAATTSGQQSCGGLSRSVQHAGDAPVRNQAEAGQLGESAASHPDHRAEHFDDKWLGDGDSVHVVSEPEAPAAPLIEIGVTPQGYTIFRQENGAGGHRYWSDEIGGGVVVWDTCLAGAPTIEWCIAHERKVRT